MADSPLQDSSDKRLTCFARSFEVASLHKKYQIVFKFLFRTLPYSKIMCYNVIISDCDIVNHMLLLNLDYFHVMIFQLNFTQHSLYPYNGRCNADFFIKVWPEKLYFYSVSIDSTFINRDTRTRCNHTYQNYWSHPKDAMPLLPKSYFWKDDWALGSVSNNFLNFSNIFCFPRSFGNSCAVTHMQCFLYQI